MGGINIGMKTVSTIFISVALLFALTVLSANGEPLSIHPDNPKNAHCKEGYRFEAGKCISATVPENAERNILGTGWNCKRGFVARGNVCAPVKIPANAELDFSGHGWTCRRGFTSSNDHCAPVLVPQNAELDFTGHKWMCKRGFKQAGAQCSAVMIPKNAELDFTGHRWACKSGFALTNDKCEAVRLPLNAQLDFTGHSWTCKSGYKRAGSACQPMTPADFARQRELYRRLRALRRRFSGAGDSFTTSRGARFVLSVDNASLDCNEAIGGGYDSCTINISYSISTDYNGLNDPTVDIDCSSDVVYSDNSGFDSSTSASDSDGASMSSNSYSGEMTLNVSFSSLDPVVRVRVSSTSCQISDVR